MLSFAADENFNNDIVRGLLRRLPDLDLIKVQDAGLSGADDPAILEWAAQENRVLLTHDVTTMTMSGKDKCSIFHCGDKLRDFKQTLRRGWGGCNQRAVVFAAN